MENARENLNTYIQEAEELIEKTNTLLSKDKKILALECSCYISVPIIHEKENKCTDLAKVFEQFIIVLLDQMNERILRQFDDTEMVYNEMAILDPRNAETAFAETNDVSLKKLAKINGIVNETTALDELRIFTSEYSQYQNRPKFEAIFNDSELYDSQLEHYDDELTSFLFEDELDI